MTTYTALPKISARAFDVLVSRAGFRKRAPSLLAARLAMTQPRIRPADAARQFGLTRASVSYYTSRLTRLHDHLIASDPTYRLELAVIETLDKFDAAEADQATNAPALPQKPP